MKKFLPFLIVIILAVATGVGGYFGYNEYQKNQDEKKQSGTNTNNGQSSSGTVQSSSSVPITQQSSSSSETSVTDGWTEYVDPDYGFRVSYPEGWDFNVSSGVSQANIKYKILTLQKDDLGLVLNINETTRQSGIQHITNTDFEKLIKIRVANLTLVRHSITPENIYSFGPNGTVELFYLKSSPTNNIDGELQPTFKYGIASIGISYSVGKNNFSDSDIETLDRIIESIIL